MTETMSERQKPEPQTVQHLAIDSVPLPWLAAVVLRGRWTIVKFGVVGLILSAAGSLLQRPQYLSSFSFIPQAASDQSKSGLASLAGQFGLAIGGLAGAGQSPQLYVDIINSRDVLQHVVSDSLRFAGDPNRMSVSDFLRVSGRNPNALREKTLDELRTHVVSATVATRTSGAVTVSVRTRSPEASLQIAQRLLDGLNQFNRTTRQGQAGEERRFVEARLNEARVGLRAAEDRLQQFLQQNRIANSPQLKFDQERLERELSLQQQVVVELSQQFEDARIREVRDTPVITVIDHPALPATPLPAHRIRLLVLGTFAAVMIGAAVIIARAGWHRQREMSGDPSYAMLADEWRSLRNGLRLR
jgi:uncharacterized protein involved in exopolysaccharide biosynthesis